MQQLNENYSNSNSIAMLGTANPSEMGKIFSYNGNKVTMRMQEGVVYVNLTEFAKPFPSKNLTQIINSQEIKEYISALSELQNYSSADLLIVRKGGNISHQGTWAHQKVALRVAQKLSPEFAVWVDTKIEELLTTGHCSVQQQYQIPQSFGEALMLAAQQQIQIEAQQKQLMQKEEEITELKAENVELQKQSEYTRVILQSKQTVLVTQIAQDYGMSARKFNLLLRDLGIQHKVRNQWILYGKYLNKGYVHSTTHNYTHTNGSPDVSLNTEWTQKGRLFLYEELKKHSFLPLIEREMTN
jgi:phage antirepressor YoqD-like protein|nr:MAG TPA: antirepressor protein [Caudoviricetes sp.]